MIKTCIVAHSSPIKGTYVNRADHDQTPQNKVSDQGLHCLLTGISIGNRMKIKTKSKPDTLNRPIDNDGRVHYALCIYIG